MLLKWAICLGASCWFADCYLIDDPEKDAASPEEQATLLSDENKSGSVSE